MQIQEIVKKIKNNQIGIFPCDTIWGLIGAFTEQSIGKLQSLKRLDANKPFIILIPNINYLNQLITPLSDKQKFLIQKYWPGPLTIIFSKNNLISSKKTANLSTIAIRYPKYRPLNELLTDLQAPIVSTSINISGDKFAKTLSEVPSNILQNIDFIYKESVPTSHQSSTIINSVQYPFHILRQGDIRIDSVFLED